eukprot:244422_1
MMQSQIRKPLLLVLICFMFFTTSCASMDDDSMYDDSMYDDSMYDDYKENADSLANVDAQKTTELVNKGYAYVSAVAALATHNNNLEEALKNLNESYDGGRYKLKEYRLPNHGQNPLPPGPRAFDRDVNQRFAKSNARSNPIQSKFQSQWSNVYVPVPQSRQYMPSTSDDPSDDRMTPPGPRDFDRNVNQRFADSNTKSNPIQSNFPSQWSNVYVPVPQSRQYMPSTSDDPSDAGDLGELIWIMFILATLSAIMYAVYWMFKRAED